MTSKSRKVRIIGPKGGEHAGKPGVLHDRFRINGHETNGRFAVVEHLLQSRAIAAPLRRHHHEDEHSFVLEGSVGVWLGGEERVANAGDLVFKPRGQWHTFWNAEDTPARILELISPGGFEQAFRDLDELGGELTPEAVAVIGERYSVGIEFEGTGPVVERHGLTMAWQPMAGTPPDVANDRGFRPETRKSDDTAILHHGRAATTLMERHPRDGFGHPQGEPRRYPGMGHPVQGRRFDDAVRAFVREDTPPAASSRASWAKTARTP